MPIHRIAYVSVPHPALTGGDIADILRAARARNASLKLSGMLLHEFGRFIQLLEGPAASLETVLDAISRDTRHTNMRVFLSQSGFERSFGRWAMWSHFSRGELTEGETHAREILQRAALENLADMERETARRSMRARWRADRPGA
ncbi:BLUF domain-containing protein [Fulvimarina endophytica]|nr:BLUF domain-containing protein [Fulvimarina endophytica]